MGDRVNAWRLPVIQRTRKPDPSRSDRGFWDRLTRTVMKRPIPSIILSSAVLLAAATPLLDIEIGAAGISSLPEHVQSKQGSAILDREFAAGRTDPVEVAVDGDVGSDAVQAGMARLISIVQSEDTFGTLLTEEPEMNPEKDLAVISMALKGDALADPALDFVRKLRSDLVPQAFQVTVHQL